VKKIFALLFLLSLAPAAQARPKGDSCQDAWSRAVRSFLTQNRKAGPDGNQPKTLDDEELIAQAWTGAFDPACKLEESGKKKEARVEAALIGAQILAKLDKRGCIGFMNAYMQSSKAKDICDVAGSAGSEELRKQIEGSIPAR
jgi:hypothetical protein